MPLFKHSIRSDRLGEIAVAAAQLGKKSIAAAMTGPLGQLKRTFREKAEALEDDEQTIRDFYTEWEKDDAGNVIMGRDDKPVPAKVFATEEDGSPKFKVDGKGKPTDEREIVQGQIRITNLLLYDREVRARRREYVEVEVPHLQWAQLEGKLKEVEGNVVEALWDFFDGKPDITADAERAQAKAARKADAASDAPTDAEE